MFEYFYHDNLDRLDSSTRNGVTKGFSNVSEYLRRLLREAQDRDAKARLEGLLLEGLTSGDSKMVGKAFWADFRTEAHRLVAERGAIGKTK